MWTDKRLWLGAGLLGLLLLGRRKMKTEQQLSPNFRLSEFLRSPGFPELAYYTPSASELTSLKYLVRYVLQPLRDNFGPVYISGSMRPKDLRNGAGQTFYQYLRSKGFHPAEHSDHELFAGTDFQLRGKPYATYLEAFHWLQANPYVRQVILYLETDNQGKRYVDHIHVSVIRPNLPKLPPDRFAFATLDGKRLDEDYA